MMEISKKDYICASSCASISQENKGNKESDEVSQTWTCNQEMFESETLTLSKGFFYIPADF